MKTSTLLLCVALAGPLTAQEGERPADWRVRFDQANAQESDLEFVTMESGWHITTGPSGIFYDPARTAEGNFRFEGEIFLFDPGRRQREAFGLFFGGQNLDADSQAYVYFLIRNDGRYLIKRRAGSATEDITPWTEHAAIVRQDGGEESAKNVLAIETGADEVSFYINDEKVASHPRPEIQADGVVGLRVNHGLNLHVSALRVLGR